MARHLCALLLTAQRSSGMPPSLSPQSGPPWCDTELHSDHQWSSPRQPSGSLPGQLQAASLADSPRLHLCPNILFFYQVLCFPANIFQRINSIIFMTKRSYCGSLTGVGFKWMWGCAPGLPLPLLERMEKMWHWPIIR